MTHRNDLPTDDRSTVVTRTIGRITGWLGSVPAILLAFGLIAAWLIGAAFVKGRFGNDLYQLVINTVTTVITFVMVFIIQNTQNRDGRAIQAKLDAQSEALFAIANQMGTAGESPALMRLVGVEDAPDKLIKEQQERVRQAARSKPETQTNG